MINSYPNIISLDHKIAKDILNGDNLVVQEKVDGSQFSFGVHNGELVCKSKGKDQYPQTDEMFTRAVEQVMKRQDVLHDGWTYRCEYLQKPKHNTLAYERTPVDYLIGYDVMTETLEDYLPVEQAKAEFERLGLEFVRVYNMKKIDRKVIESLLEGTSALGIAKIEGVVIKDYSKFTPDHKPLMAKLVREQFKEDNRVAWKNARPNKEDLYKTIIDTYKTEARWAKSVQHLKEEGLLTGTPKDIGILIAEVHNDIKKECEDEIKDILFAHAWKDIERGTTRGFPEWYIDLLEEKGDE